MKVLQLLDPPPLSSQVSTPRMTFVSMQLTCSLAMCQIPISFCGFHSSTVPPDDQRVPPYTFAAVTLPVRHIVPYVFKESVPEPTSISPCMDEVPPLVGLPVFLAVWHRYTVLPDEVRRPRM